MRSLKEEAISLAKCVVSAALLSVLLIILTLFFMITFKTSLLMGIGFSFAIIALFIDGNLEMRFATALTFLGISVAGNAILFVIGIFAIPWMTLVIARWDEKEKRLQAAGIWGPFSNSD